MGILVVLDFSCFVLPPLVLHQSKIGLEFCLEGLESLTLGDRGRVILPLNVRLVLGMEGFSDLLVILVELVFMRSGFCSRDFLCSLGDCILEGGSFLGTGFGGQAILELFIERFLELSQADRILQSSDVVGGPDSLESVSVRWSDVQRQYSPDQPVVGPAFSTSHGTGHPDVPDIALAYNDEIDHVPVF